MNEDERRRHRHLEEKLGRAMVVVETARRLLEVQRGTMSSMAPSGVALRAALKVYDDFCGAEEVVRIR